MSESSRTVTLLEIAHSQDAPASDEPVGALRLRGAPRQRTRETQRVVWRDDVVDNEGAGKKSSKICCIYHKPRSFDESSSEDDSSDSDSDDSCDSHDHSHGSGRQHPNRSAPEGNGAGPSTRSRDGASVVHEIKDDGGDANAYEKLPGKKPKNKGNKPIPNGKS